MLDELEEGGQYLCYSVRGWRRVLVTTQISYHPHYVTKKGQLWGGGVNLIDSYDISTKICNKCNDLHFCLTELLKKRALNKGSICPM